jgi:Na+-driven multidrug efflux pump
VSQAAARTASEPDRRPPGAGPGPGAPDAPTERPGIWELAWPSILTSLLYSVVGIAAVRVVGDIGPSAVAAVTTGTQVFFGMQAVMMAISVGTTALVARAWGADDRDEAVRVTIASLLLGFGAAVGLGLPVFLWADPLAGLFLEDPASRAMAAEFIRWQAVFNWAFGINFILAAALRAAGDARSPLWVTGVVNVVNILLLPVLVHGRLGAPALGVAGAALATGIALSLGAAAFLGLWLTGCFRLPFRRLAAFDRARLGQHSSRWALPAGARAGGLPDRLLRLPGASSAGCTAPSRNSPPTAWA